MKEELELRVPQSKGGYIAAQFIEFSLYVVCGVIAYFFVHPIVLAMLPVIVGAALLILRLIRHSNFVMNDEGIHIYGYPQTKEPIFIKWEEVANIVLARDKYEGVIEINFKSNKREQLRLIIHNYTDLRDKYGSWFISNPNKRIKNLLEALCKAHNVRYKEDEGKRLLRD